MKTWMPIEGIEDWEKRLDRLDAFWEAQILDRPVVRVPVPKAKPVRPLPQKRFAGHRDRWMDFGYNAEWHLANVLNTDYLGDALPCVFPNLGPEVFSAFFGQELEYGEHTAWSAPILKDWADADRLKFSTDNFYWKKVLEYTDVLLEAGQGRFYVGMTDLHPGADALAAFRDPAELCMDMILHPEEVKKMLERITQTFFGVYDTYYQRLAGAGQAICSWMSFCSRRKWAIPSNDFSCMISKEMFDETFLPGVIQECRHMEANIYHLDGPNALRHLDSLLAIKELQAIQWVYGAGKGQACDWLDVYRKCQAAGKGLLLDIGVEELDFVIENLKPEGLNIGITNATSCAQAEAIIQRVAQWR